MFQVQGSGIPLSSYKWQRKSAGSSTWINVTDDTTYTGATIPTLTTSAVSQSMDSDQFQCILSNSSGSITTSPPAVLTVIPIGVSTLAGLARTSGSADGLGSAARFTFPSGLVVDGTGIVYVTDRNNNTIRNITPAGAVTTIAGLAQNAGYADGTNGSARFNFPIGICMDSAGNLYVADLNNQVIRKMTLSGANWIVTRFAGQPGLREVVTVLRRRHSSINQSASQLIHRPTFSSPIPAINLCGVSRLWEPIGMSKHSPPDLFSPRQSAWIEVGTVRSGHSSEQNRPDITFRRSNRRRRNGDQRPCRWPRHNRNARRPSRNCN